MFPKIVAVIHPDLSEKNPGYKLSPLLLVNSNFRISSGNTRYSVLNYFHYLLSLEMLSRIVQKPYSTANHSRVQNNRNHESWSMVLFDLFKLDTTTKTIIFVTRIREKGFQIILRYYKLLSPSYSRFILHPEMHFYYLLSVTTKSQIVQNHILRFNPPKLDTAT